MNEWAIAGVSIAAAAVAVVVLALGAWMAIRRANRHPLVRRVLALPARGKLSLVRRLLTSPEVPLLAKLTLPALLLYLALPFDLVPDFIPALGYADDALAIAGAIALVLWLTPADVFEHAIEAEELRTGARG
ncbi:MAG TPA: YkvA family protein [Dehalococcoidia bacterium]|nr:YkvA family protein [Dehalococcoidia bacterium]